MVERVKLLVHFGTYLNVVLEILSKEQTGTVEEINRALTDYGADYDDMVDWSGPDREGLYEVGVVIEDRSCWTDCGWEYDLGYVEVSSRPLPSHEEIRETLDKPWPFMQIVQKLVKDLV